jgi:hypothetical protein
MRMRALGLTGAGQPLHGLPPDFTLDIADMPDEPEDSQAGHDLPDEVMRVLCDSLDLLELMASTEIRVITAIQDAARSGAPVSVSSIARAARVDRSFLYRHPDFLAQVHAVQGAPGEVTREADSHAALQADLANAHDRNHRLAARVRQPETRLSQLLGEQAWRASGLGAAAHIDELQRELTRLEQAHIDLTAQLDERTEELRAARDANRELTRALNQRRETGF